MAIVARAKYTRTRAKFRMALPSRSVSSKFRDDLLPTLGHKERDNSPLPGLCSVFPESGRFLFQKSAANRESKINTQYDSRYAIPSADRSHLQNVKGLRRVSIGIGSFTAKRRQRIKRKLICKTVNRQIREQSIVQIFPG